MIRIRIGPKMSPPLLDQDPMETVAVDNVSARAPTHGINTCGCSLQGNYIDNTIF